MILLVGPSAVGKTEVGRTLKNKYGYNKLITYTTRAPRVGEINHVDYHFISVEEFIQKQNDGFFFESVNYATNYYGTALEDIDASKYVIVDPQGLINYKKSDLYCVAFFLEASEDIRIERMKYRQDKQEDINRRVELDRIHFSKEIVSLCDYVVDVDYKTLDEIAEEIHKLYKK